jgi:hypothetical protein
MTQHVNYDNWTIYWEQADVHAYKFWIETELLKSYDGSIETIHLNVGFFRDTDRGLATCQNLINLCLQEQKRVTIGLIEVYRQNRQYGITAKILGTTKHKEGG